MGATSQWGVTMTKNCFFSVYPNYKDIVLIIYCKTVVTIGTILAILTEISIYFLQNEQTSVQAFLNTTYKKKTHPKLRLQIPLVSSKFYYVMDAFKVNSL